MSAEIMHGNCLEVMRGILSGSIDMILCDLPYGMTQNAWDSVFPLDALWEEYERLIKPAGAIVLTAMQPFTSALILSNLPLFKYAWVWDKVNRASGHLNAKKQPLRATEDVLVFYRRQPTYNPQMEARGSGFKATSKGSKSSNYGSQADGITTVNSGLYYPKNIISIPADQKSEGRLHPTQKPVALFEYLIRTYTLPGETVLDNCAGSGTTGVAAIQCGRRAILIEQDAGYVQIARDRIANTQPALLETA